MQAFIIIFVRRTSLSKYAHMPSYKRLTEAERREIATKYRKGHSITSLAHEYKASRQSISKWVKRPGKSSKKFKDLHRKARASVVSKRQRQSIKQSALKGKTAVAIAKRTVGSTGQPISTSTARRVLTQGTSPLHWLPIKRKRVLSPHNKQMRIDFCNRHLNSQVGSWVFGDAKIYHMYKCSCGYLHGAWQKLDGEVHIRMSTVPDVFMFYAFIGKGIKSQLIFTDPSPPARSKQHKSKATFNSASFQRVVDKAIEYLTPQSGSKKRKVVVLDRAKQHTSKASMDHLTKCGVHLLEGYPAQSWDINVIENVWGILDTKLLGARACTSRGWREAIEKAWDKIPQGTINDLVSEVKQRMAAIIQKDGDWAPKVGQ